jgi:2-methylisocitrate lyase-like PEP mutase family enzyme
MYGSELRSLLEEGDEILTVPGIHDPLTARMADLVGFDCLYMTGYGTSVSKPGYPDVGLITMTEMVENARNIQERIGVPLIADADTGYGNATNVVRTVREYLKTDVGAIHIEDQALPKRCGSLAGKRVIPLAEAEGKIAAAADTVGDEEMLIIGRTDARGAENADFDDAIERASRFAAAGADVVFVAGLKAEDEVERTGEAVDAPLFYETPLTGPRISSERLDTFGYDIVAYPLFSTQVVMTHMYEHLLEVKESDVDGVNAVEAGFADIPIDESVDKPRDKLHYLSGLSEIEEIENRYVP